MLQRPASATERFFAMTNSMSFMNSCYILSLSSSRPLTEQVLRVSLRTLLRRVPVLQVGFQNNPETGDLWTKQLDVQSTDIDYEILREADLEKEIRRMTDHSYNTEIGPLWKVRLIPQNKQQQEMTNQKPSTSSHYFDEISAQHQCSQGDVDTRKPVTVSMPSTNDTSYESNMHDTRCASRSSSESGKPTDLAQSAGSEPNSGDPCDEGAPCAGENSRTQYTLLFGIHHGVADGFTNVRICSLLLSIINETMLGNPSDANKLIGVCADYSYTEAIVEKGLDKLRDGAVRDYLDRVHRLATSHSNRIGNIFSATQPTAQTEPKTLRLKYTFSAEETRRMFQVCRQQSITINSFFTALLNLSFLRLTIQKNNSVDPGGFTDDEVLVLNAEHTVNTRKLWPTQASEAVQLGVHITMVLVSIPTSVTLLSNFTETFWPYAKQVHSEIKRNTDSEALGLQIAYLESLGSEFESNDGRPQGSPRSCFSITNMGDVTEALPGVDGGDCVKLVDVDRSTSIHKLSMLSLHVLHTFRGRLTHNIVYSSYFLDDETVIQWRDDLHAMIRALQ